jgi:hypothetical protein
MGVEAPILDVVDLHDGRELLTGDAEHPPLGLEGVYVEKIFRVEGGDDGA